MEINFDEIHKITALQLLALALSLYSLTVVLLNNMISRKFKFAIDKFAVCASNSSVCFVGVFEKLADFNFAENKSDTPIESLFYEHTTIKKKIEFTRKNLDK